MVARSQHEAMQTTVICPEPAVPPEVERDGGWHVIRVEGVFAFGEVGVLASLIDPLRDGRLAVLTVGTFETDYLLIKAERLDRVREVLEAARHRFIQEAE